MAAGDVLYLPGDKVVAEAGEGITKGQLLYPSAASTNYIFKAKKTTAPTDACIAVALESQATTGGPVAVLLCAAIVEVVSDDAITFGKPVTGGSTTAGRVAAIDEAALATGVRTGYVFGIALKAATGAGEVIPVAVMQGVYVDSGQAP